jgi:hypothetical protein
MVPKNMRLKKTRRAMARGFLEAQRKSILAKKPSGAAEGLSDIILFYLLRQ